MWPSSRLLLIQPTAFRFDPETAQSNVFQKSSGQLVEEIQKQANTEFENVCELLGKNDIETIQFKGIGLPDEVFPNNWLMIDHQNQLLHLFPMKNKLRQMERREDIVSKLQSKFMGYQLRDWSYFEKANEFCEGTGSLVLQRNKRLAFACLSDRTSKLATTKIVDEISYQLIQFQSNPKFFSQIYHTNVMMACGEKTVVICKAAISIDDRDRVCSVIESEFETKIDISPEQLKCFCGNILLAQNNQEKKFWLMSHSAYSHFDRSQKALLEKEAPILWIKIPMIEKIGGGSLRCMLAEA